MSDVLIVDDEKNVLKTLSIGLRRYNYSVRQAKDGKKALQIMDEDPCRIIISDIRMSSMNGYTLASLILKKYPCVSIILMSAFSFEEDQNREEMNGVKHRLTKPFSIEDLDAIIREEERKYGLGYILVVGEKVEGGNIEKILLPYGYRVRTQNLKKEMRVTIKNPYDLFLIDAESLENSEWKILNDIDNLAPHTPVVVLASNSGKRDFLKTPDLSVTVLDKEVFYKDPSKCNQLLKDIINPNSTNHPRL